MAHDSRADDLRDVAGRAKETWIRAGAEIVGVAPRFLFDDETIGLRIPPSTKTKPSNCLTVTVIGPRGLGLHGHLVRAGSDADAEVASVAGVLEMSSCDAPLPARLVLSAISGRGAIETVVAYSAAALPPAQAIFPERAGGLIPAVPEPGALPPLASPSLRADVAEARARSESATIAARQTFASSADGSGSLQIQLDAGCHRIEVFGVDPRSMGGKGHLDVDAELRDADDDTVLARDRTEAPDAHLEACVGGDTLAEVYFAGPPARSEVALTHAVWAIPEHLPRTWGREPRARMAAALRARHALSPTEDPIAIVQGPAGVTPVPLEVEPGACYLAVAAIAHGSPRGLGLRAVAGGQVASDERGLNDDSGVVAFCARGERSANIFVDARGTSLSWVLALFRVSRGAWSTR